jgi:transcriptional regulator with XRE-family HTH domain
MQVDQQSMPPCNPISPRFLASFGERLRERRRSRSLTQVRLAALLRVTPSTVGRYERGVHAPAELRVLLALRQELGASLDYLLLGAGPPQLADRELARLFRAADELPPERRREVAAVLGALLQAAGPRPAP